MLIFMSPSHHPYPFVNVKLPLQSPERRVKRERKEHRALLHFSIDVESERKSGSDMFRFRVTCRTTLLYVPALPSGAAAHPPFTSKGLEERRAVVSAELVRNRRVGAFFLHLSLKAASCIEQRPELVCDSVSFSLLLISNVLSVDPQVIRTWQVMSVTRCCVQNSFPWDCSVFRLSVLNYFCLVGFPERPGGFCILYIHVRKCKDDI